MDSVQMHTNSIEVKCNVWYSYLGRHGGSSLFVIELHGSTGFRQKMPSAQRVCESQ